MNSKWKDVYSNWVLNLKGFTAHEQHFMRPLIFSFRVKIIHKPELISHITPFSLSERGTTKIKDTYLRNSRESLWYLNNFFRNECRCSNIPAPNGDSRVLCGRHCTPSFRAWMLRGNDFVSRSHHWMFRISPMFLLLPKSVLYC